MENHLNHKQRILFGFGLPGQLAPLSQMGIGCERAGGGGPKSEAQAANRRYPWRHGVSVPSPGSLCNAGSQRLQKELSLDVFRVSERDCPLLHYGKV